jgi:DNA-binding CsgD family transcriptional regulator
MIGSIGTAPFYDCLCVYVAEQARVPFVELLRFFPDRSPDLIWTSDSAALRPISHGAYFSHFYKFDPFYIRFLEDRRSGLNDMSELRARYPSRRYFREFYPQSNFSSEVGGTVACADGSALNLRVASARDDFHPREWSKEQFHDLWLIAQAAITKHTALVDACREPQREVPTMAAFNSAKTLFGTSVLAKRELEVVRYLLSGYPVAVFARKMDISYGTAKNYCKSIYRKLDIRSKGELFSLFLNSGFASECSAGVDPLLIYEARVDARSKVVPTNIGADVPVAAIMSM